MPQIQGYEEKYQPQGGLNVRATPDAFGAGIGEAMQTFGNQLERVDAKIQEADEAMDVTQVHVNMAKARAEWDLDLEKRRREAVPGDDTFAPKLMGDMDAWFKKASGSAKTRRGALVYQSLAANMSSEYSQKAVNIQSGLNSEAARNMVIDLKTSWAIRAKENPVTKASVDSVLGEIDNTFADKATLFWKIDAPYRDQLRREARREAIISYGKAAADAGVLDGDLYSPAMLKELDTYKAVLAEKAVPGGRIKLSPAALGKAPEVFALAAGWSVDPGILLAQTDALPNDNPIETHAEIMGNMIRKYGMDQEKAVAGYQAGTSMVDRAISMGGDFWKAYLPEETQAHVETVMQNAGLVPSTTPGEAEPPPPAPKTLSVKPKNPLWNELSSAQLEELSKYGVQSLQQIRTISQWTRQEKEQQKQEMEDASVNSAVQKIHNARQYGKFSIADVTNDPNLDGKAKQMVISWYLQDQERKRSSAGHVDDRGTRVNLYQDLLAQAEKGNAPNLAKANKAMMAGQISPETHVWLQSRAANIQNETGTSFGLAQRSAKRSAQKMIDGGIARFNPVLGAQIKQEAYAILNDEYEAAKDERMAAGKPTGALVDASSPDNMWSPARVNAAVQRAQGVIGGQLATGIPAQPQQTRAAVAGYVLGNTYDVEGVQMSYMGGPLDDPASWGTASTVHINSLLSPAEQQIVGQMANDAAAGKAKEAADRLAEIKARGFKPPTPEEMARLQARVATPMPEVEAATKYRETVKGRQSTMR